VEGGSRSKPIRSEPVNFGWRGRIEGMNHVYDIYDGNGYRLTSVTAPSKEEAEMKAYARYGSGHHVEIAYIDIGGKLMSWEAYMSS